MSVKQVAQPLAQGGGAVQSMGRHGGRGTVSGMAALWAGTGCHVNVSAEIK